MAMHVSGMFGSVSLAVLTLAIGLSSGCRTAPVREVTLVTRGMTFALPERPDAANPVLQFRSGEKVRLVLRNEAAGMIHDVAIPAWNVAVDAIPSCQTAETTFVVPEAAGSVEYLCRPHAQMMAGTIDVTR
jgi:plastocyanin